MRSEFDDDNKCALSQTYILTTAVTKNEREKKSAMSSYKCRYEKKCYLTIKHFSTLFFMYPMVPCEKMIIPSFFSSSFFIRR